MTGPLAEFPAAPRPGAPSRSLIARNPTSAATRSIQQRDCFLWRNSDRYCSDGSDSACTLVRPAHSDPFTIAMCKANLPSAAVNTTTYAWRRKTGSPKED